MSEHIGYRRPLRRANASAYLLDRFGINASTATLAKYASVGGGPPYYKAGAVPLYPLDELEEWALGRLGKLRRSSSDKGE